ncbi:hypothetical protein P7K49_030243 [Saguinus oedipus]|uniref:Uncharacterized protein n=1 Tax=Saguinus oedipus TaxID=9490 RepID=A0ABQ9U1P1_SAGOE|nr:hypothetical protein P7K49_030243 [Saguinus oedipus]
MAEPCVDSPGFNPKHLYLCCLSETRAAQTESCHEEIRGGTKAEEIKLGKAASSRQSSYSAPPLLWDQQLIPMLYLLSHSATKDPGSQLHDCQNQLLTDHSSMRRVTENKEQSKVKAGDINPLSIADDCDYIALSTEKESVQRRKKVQQNSSLYYFGETGDVSVDKPRLECGAGRSAFHQLICNPFTSFQPPNNAETFACHTACHVIWHLLSTNGSLGSDMCLYWSSLASLCTNEVINRDTNREQNGGNLFV